MIFNLHSDVGIPPPQLMQHSLDDWMATDSKKTTCGLALQHLVPGAPHYLGVVNTVNPSTGQFM